MIEVRVPDIGDFVDVPVIEILVAVGDPVKRETSLVTLESEKASLEVPSPAAGVVRQLAVQVGDRVSEGSLLLMLESADDQGHDSGDVPQTEPAGGPAEAAAPAKSPESTDSPDRPEGTKPRPGTQAIGSASAAGVRPSSVASGPAPDADLHAQLVVLGGGPGGYTAAFRAADLGVRTVLIEREEQLGGVCLNVGCIPSKALLHAARVLTEAHEVGDAGISFGKPEIDIERLRSWKQSVVERLTGGLAGLAKQRKVEVIRGTGRFAGDRLIEVQGADGATTVAFDSCIIAAGSTPARIPGLPDDERIMDSTAALELAEIPPKLLVIGGGIIGLELATVYDALGSSVTVVELLDHLIDGCDADLIKPLQKRIEARYDAILLGTKVAEARAQENGIELSFDGEGAPAPQLYDRVLVAVGRRPNGKEIGADAAGVEVDERGFVGVDDQMRTNVPHIHAVGDIVGEPMLAHKATHQGKVAAELIAGHDVGFDPRAIPAVAYTDPEIAWMGVTETRAKAEGIPFERGVFPWAASGRALTLGRDEGLTKLIFDPKTRRLLGAGIVGPNAGELIAEAVHALEMGSDASDLALSIHPHPTLSETVGLAAEAAEGTITDLIPKRR